MKSSTKKRFIQSVLFGVILVISCSSDEEKYGNLSVKEYPERRNDFSLWQLEQFYGEVQMGYILRTDDRKITVVDGGLMMSGAIVEKYLMQLGGRVHTWLISHPHKDHGGVLLEVIKSKRVKIDRIIHSQLDLDLILKHEPQAYEFASLYYEGLQSSGIPLIDAKKEETYVLGQGVDLKILGAANKQILMNLVNNSSLVFRVKSENKSVLFLGDLGAQGGNEVLKYFSKEDIASDYVQMAHHGQDGVDKTFYEAVSAKYALWPTPTWLWENNLEAKGFNTGNWKTLFVRDWMQELKIVRNYVAGLEGTIQID